MIEEGSKLKQIRVIKPRFWGFDLKVMELGRISLDKVNEVTEEKPDCGLDSDSSSARSKKNESSLHGVLRWLKRVAVDPCKPELCSAKTQCANNADFIKRKRKHDVLLPETSKATSKMPRQKSEQQGFVESSKRQCSSATPIPSLFSNNDSEDCSELILQNPLDSVSELESYKKISSKSIFKGPSLQANTMDQNRPHEKETWITDLDSDDSDNGSSPLISKEEGSLSVKEGHSLVKQTPNLPDIQPDLTGRSSPSTEEVSPLLCPDESVSSSNLSGPLKPQKHQKPRKSIGLLSLIHSRRPRLAIPIGPQFQAEVPGWTGLPKMNDLPDVDLDDSKWLGKNKSPQKSIRTPNLTGDEHPRMAIPVGPRFQAEVPDWIGLPKMKNLSDGGGDLDNSKWLGTKIWPIEGIDIETSTVMLGERMHYSCSCDSPGSTECTKHHITEERDRLKSELGPAFFSWKFDEMGEQVSHLWTEEEQKGFQDLLKTNPMSNSKAFWRTAFKRFPDKRRESIVSYYFNVHVLRHISRQTRLGGAIVDTDDEADENVHKSKNLGNQYLSQLR